MGLPCMPCRRVDGSHSHSVNTVCCRYQSTIMGSFQTLELIETFINYQESIKRCICIIYDPQRTKTGGLKVSTCNMSVCVALK